MRVIAQTKIWCGQNMLALLPVAASLMLAATAASAAEYHGFVKNQWYIGKGGKAVSLNDFAANPPKYLRPGAAYDHLRHHMAKTVGKKSLSDAEFRNLLKSDKVRLVACTGQIKTAGITDGGQVGWKERSCYQNENLIMVQVAGVWTIVASQGCYNPVMAQRPPLPLSPITPGPSLSPAPVAPPVQSSPPPVVRTAEPAPAKDCRWVLTGSAMTATQVIVTPSRINDSCLGPNLVTGQTIIIPGGAVTTYTCIPN